jgi:hypothetical protein
MEHKSSFPSGLLAIRPFDPGHGQAIRITLRNAEKNLNGGLIQAGGRSGV